MQQFRATSNLGDRFVVLPCGICFLSPYSFEAASTSYKNLYTLVLDILLCKKIKLTVLQDVKSCNLILNDLKFLTANTRRHIPSPLSQ